MPMNASQMSLEADRDLARQRVGICDAGQICEDTRISQALGDRCLAISSQSPERRGDRSWVHRRDVISSPSIRVASGVPGTKVAATERAPEGDTSTPRLFLARRLTESRRR